MPALLSAAAVAGSAVQYETHSPRPASLARGPPLCARVRLISVQAVEWDVHIIRELVKVVLFSSHTFVKGKQKNHTHREREREREGEGGYHNPTRSTYFKNKNSS